MKINKLILVLLLLLFPKQWIVAQCDVNQKYDKIISGYHSSIALQDTGDYAVWGSLMNAAGTGDILQPQDINSTNYPALTGTVLRATIGGKNAGAGVDQGIALTTTGLWAWGVAGNVVSTTVKAGTALGRTSTTAANGFNTYGLPSTLTPTDVKSIYATYQTLVLVTKIVNGVGGDVWVLTQTSLALEANGGATATAGTSRWKQVRINATTYLTGVTDTRGQVSNVTYNALMAITESGQVYTWGNSSYLGNAAVSAARNYATLMTLPTEFATSVPKMIGVTGGIGTTTTTKNTYYLLSEAGNLYALGHNSQRQCGDFTTTERTSWVGVQKSATAGDYFTGVTFFSCQEHNSSYPGLSFITSSADLYSCGNNSSGMIGRTDNGLISGGLTTVSFNPGIVVGFVGNAVYVELGGHTMVYFIEGTTQFCYVGHQISGSMGDNTTTGAGTISTTALIHNCVDTPYVTICGYVPVAASTTNSTIAASPTSISANGISTSTITVSLKDPSNVPLTISGGAVLMSTTAGTITSVTDNNNGTYTATLTSSTTPTTATVSFTINGSAATHSATVAFVAPTASTVNSLITASPISILANGTATATVTVSLKDSSNIALLASGGTVTINTTAGTLGAVTNNNNGTYTATLTSSSSTSSVTATVSFTVNGTAGTATATVLFVAPASTSNSTITASPTSIVATGTSTTVITVTLKNASGTALTISGGTVTMATTAGTLGAVTNNNNGTYTATLTSSTVVGSANISFKINGTAASNTATVSFVAPAILNNSTILASPTSTISTSTITVTLKNSSNVALSISGGTVTMTTNLGTLSAVTDNNNGTYTAILSSSNPAANANATVSFKLNGSANSTNTATVQFLATASTTNSIITATPTAIAANGAATSTITVQLRNASNGNFIISGGNVTMAATNGTLGIVTNNNNGSYTATLTSSTVIGSSVVSFKLNGVTCTNTATVTFTAPIAAVNNCLITASPSSITANGTSTSTITVTLRDANLIPLTSSGGTVTMTTTSGSLLPVTDNNNGTYTATLISSTMVTTATVSFKVGASTTSTNTASVVFTAPVASTTNSTITASPTSILANGTATSVVTVSLKDATGVALTVSGGTVTMATTAGTLGAVTNNNNGTYTATLTSSNSSTNLTATLSFTLNGTLASNTSSVLFIAPASTTNSTIIANPTSILATGATTSLITVTLRNASDSALGISGGTVTMSATTGTIGIVTNNNNGTYTATLTSSNSTTNVTSTISFAINGSTASNTETVDFLSAATTANSTISASPTSILANGISTSTITVTLKNAAGIPLTISGGTVTMARSTGGTLSAVTNNNNGTYTATLTSSTTVQNSTITFKINGSANSVNTAVVSYIALPSAATSLIATNPTSIVANGLSTTQVTVTLRNAANGVLPVSGGTVVMTTTAGTLSAVTDNEDGTYTATLTSTTAITTATLGFSLNGTTGTNTTTVSFVVPASTTNSTIVASPKTILADGLATSTLTVTLKNASNIALTLSGGTVDINTNVGSIGAVTDNNNGTYTAILTSSTNVETATLFFTLNGVSCSNTETVSFIIPTITTSGTLTPFSSCNGSESSEESFTVSGTTLVGNITVLAPTGYEIATVSGGAFASTINLTPISGTVATTTTYVRLKSNAVDGASGNISCTSSGAATRVVPTETATVKALPTLTGTTPATRCGIGTVTLGATTSAGTINWYAAATGGIVLGTGTSFTSPSISNTTTYYADVVNNSCTSASRTAVVASVSTSPVSGTITGATTVCSGTNSSLLTLTGNTGTIQWQSSSDNITFANINGATNSTYTATNLTSTTYYRVAITSGVCSAVPSPAVAITVNTASIGGTVSSNQTICTGTAPADLTLSGNTGNVIRWEKATNVGFTAGLVTIATTSSTLTGATIGNLTANTYFRAVVQNSPCVLSNSAAALVTITTASIGGTAAGTQTVCLGLAPGTNLTLSGNTGNVVKWQSALNAAFTSSLTDIANTTNTLTGAAIGPLMATTYFRAVVQNGSCTPVNSSTATVTVTTITTGNITFSAGAAITCRNSTVTLRHSLNTAGSTRIWQSSSDNINFTNIAGATGRTYTVPTTTAGIFYYRVNYTTGGCTLANSSVSVTVDGTTVAGTVSAAQTICSGATPTDLTLSGNTGNVIRWEKATNIGFTAGLTTIANTSSTLTGATIGALTANTYFRAVVQNGSCLLVNTAGILITVNANGAVGGSVSGTQTICSGAAPSTNLVSTGRTGSILNWQSATNAAFTSPVTIASTATTLTGAIIGPLSTTTYFRAVVQNGSCTNYSSSVTVTVTPISFGGLVSSDQISTCSYTLISDLVLSGNIGSVLKWQKSSDAAFTSPTDIAVTATTLNGTAIGAIMATTYFRAVVQSGLCSVAYSTYATISVAATTWNGTSWSNGTPTSASAVIMTGNFSSTTNYNSADLYACTLTITNNASVLVPSGSNFIITGAVTVTSGSSLTMESNTNLVQIESAVANSGNIIVKRDTSPLLRLDYVLWSTPVVGQNLFNFSPLTALSPTIRFYTYNSLFSSVANPNGIYNVVPSPTSVNFDTGTGYLIRVPNTFSASTPTVFHGQFQGTPNNGDLNITVPSGKYVATGNPYPSTIDADLFMSLNNVGEALYYWRKTNNTQSSSYATYTLLGGTSNSGGLSSLEPTSIIQVGQGFIMKTTSTTLRFTNALRLNNNDNLFFKTATVEKNRIWLNLSAATFTANQMMVGYVAGATEGIDPMLDGLYINDNPIALNSLINNEEYTIQGRSPFVATDVVPLAFKTNIAGDYSIAIDHVDGLFAGSQNVFLKDNLTNTTTNLSASAYSFASEAGTFNNRFEIVYQNQLGTATPTFNENSVVVYKNQDQIHINSGTMLMDNIIVYDIRGRVLLQKKKVGATKITLDCSGLTNQVLLIQIISDENIKVVKKVIN